MSAITELLVVLTVKLNDRSDRLMLVHTPAAAARVHTVVHVMNAIDHTAAENVLRRVYT